jgi:protein-S-isoprenylcysteine O-methyltransferase Ste14
MYWFLVPLISGFISNVASSFTTFYSDKWGKTRGRIFTVVLRDITGIPVWASGFVLAIRESEVFVFGISLSAQVTGWLMILAGAVVIVIALASIGIKAAAPSTEDTLVNKGIYSVIRNPIHSGTFLEFTGIFFLHPSFNTGLAFLLGCLWIFCQTKFEEKDLIRRIPEYSEYMKQVPRFFPSFSVKK